MSAVKPNWNKLRNRYVTTDISLRKLAAESGIPFPTVRDCAKREKWVVLREEYRNKIVTNTLQKTVEKISESDSDFNFDINRINAVAAQKVLLMLENVGDNPKYIKSLTGALKDITDIKRLSEKISDIDDTVIINIVSED